MSPGWRYDDTGIILSIPARRERPVGERNAPPAGWQRAGTGVSFQREIHCQGRLAPGEGGDGI